jgi:hypothetical protein
VKEQRKKQRRACDETCVSHEEMRVDITEIKETTKATNAVVLKFEDKVQGHHVTLYNSSGRGGLVGDVTSLKTDMDTMKRIMYGILLSSLAMFATVVITFVRT